MRDIVRTNGCERARTWASLSLDGELSELERRLLDAHVARCGACAAFAAEIEGVVHELRGTSLEPFESGLITLTRRQRPVTPAVRVAGRIGAVAAAAAAGIAMFSLGAGSVGDVDPAGGRLPPIIVDATSTDTAEEVSAFRQMRRATLLSTASPHADDLTHSGTNPL